MKYRDNASRMSAVIVSMTLAAICARLPAQADDVGKPGASDGPPLGINAVTVTLQSVLHAYDAAVGITAHPTLTDIEQGTIAAYGQTGTYRSVYAGLRSGSDYSSSTTLGPFTSSEGRYHGQRWHRDENGDTNVMQDTVRAEEFAAQNFAAAAESTSDDVTLLGEVTAPVDAYVVQVVHKGLAPMWGFYDKKTGVLDREEIGYVGDRAIVSYDDYRLVAGNREPWHTRYSDAHPENDYDTRITSDTYGAALTDADLSIPASRQDVVIFPSGTSESDLPSDIKVDATLDGTGMVSAMPIITVTINGRGLDMLLDSTEPGMVLDDEVAKELGLDRYGPFDSDDKGSLYPTRAVVPRIDIGALRMEHVDTTLRHVNFLADGRRIVGFVGYDFLANTVVEIDYAHQVVKAYEPLQFVPPADSVPIPVNLDDNIPFVAAQIGDSVGEYFMLDDTMPFTLIYPDFYEAHPDAVKDQGSGASVNVNYFFLQDADIEATQLKTLTFGGTHFQEWLAYKATNTHDLEGVDIDGVIGCDFLRYFNVYFDYGDRAIYLEPNDVYKRAVHY